MANKNQPIKFRPSDLTLRQLNWLAEHWGATQAEVIRVTIDRIYHQERPESGDLVIHIDAGRVQVGLWCYDARIGALAFFPATNWQELEAAALDAVHTQTEGIDITDLYPCPPDIAVRVKLPPNVPRHEATAQDTNP
jgi:hypothetical protein